MEIGSLTGSLILNDSFTSTLNLAVQKLEAAGEKADKIANQFKTAGSNLSIGITAPLVAAAGASLLFAGNFEQSMTRLVSLAGVSQSELEGVKQHILDLAPAVGVGPQALADAMTVVSSVVSDTGVALSILDTSAKLSAAGLGETKDVAKALTAVINSYGAGNISAARAADILTKAVQDGGAEAAELAPTIANVVPLAAQLGVSFEEVAANIATVTKLGVPAAEAVTQLSSVMSALLRETKQGTDALASVGLTYAELRAEIKERGLQEALADLNSRFGENKTALADVFGRVEALRNVMSSAGQQAETYAEEIKRIKESSNGAGAAQTAFNAVQKDQIFTWNQLTAAIQATAVEFGDALAPTLHSVMDAAKPVLAFVIDAAKWFNQLPEPIKTTAIAVGALAAAVGPLVYLAGALVSSLVSLIPLIAPIGVALTIATGPIGLTVIAVTGLVTALALFNQQRAEIIATGQDTSRQFTETGKAAEKLATEARALAAAQPPLVDGFKLTIPVAGKTANAIKGVGTAHALTTEQIDEAKNAAKASRAAWIEYGSVVGKIQDKLAADTIEAIKYDLERGIQQGTLARVYQVTGEQVAAVAKLMDTEKEHAKQLIETEKTWLEVKVKLEGANYGLTESLRNLDRSEIVTIGRHLEMVNAIRIINDLNTQARAGFDNSAVAIENIGQKSTEIDVLKLRLAGAHQTTIDYTKTLEQIPDLLMQAFTGGGGLAGALKAIGVLILKDIVGPLMQIGTASTTAGENTRSSFNSVSVAAGLATAGIGLIATAAFNAWQQMDATDKKTKAWMQSIIDSASVIELAGAKTTQQFDQFVAVAVNRLMDLGLTAEEARKKVMAVFTVGPGNGQDRIKALNDLLEKQKSILDEIKSKYGEGKEGLTKLAERAKEVYEFMLRSGQYTAEQLAQAFEASAAAQRRAMGDTAQSTADAAEAAGYRTRADLEATARRAQETYEYMRDSGMYTAAEVEKAWKATQDAQMDAYGEATSAITGLVDQYKTLASSIADEAPEEIMGVIEAQTRAQMQVLKEQGEAQLIANGRTAAEAADEWERQLGGIHVEPVHVPVIFDFPDINSHTETPERDDEVINHYAGGGLVSASRYAAQGWSFPGKPSGSDNIPVWARQNERILSPSQNIDYEREKSQPDETMMRVLDSVDGLRNDFTNVLPRALARQLGTELATLRIS